MPTISESIRTANNSVKAVGNNFAKAVKCSGFANADFSYIFEVKEDANITNALSEFRKEKTRIEEEIIDTDKKISSAQSIIDDMNAKIKACDNNNFNSQIRSASNDMDDNKRKMDRATSDSDREHYSSQYSAAKRRKEQAEAAKRTNDINRANYVSQKNAAEKLKSDLSGEKKNLEKRLKNVNEIINLF